MLISKKVIIQEGVVTPCTGPAADALPAVQLPQPAEDLQTGVSTRNAPLPKTIQAARRAARTPHWYALRTTYGREKKAYEYLVNKGVIAFYPVLNKWIVVKGKTVKLEKSLLPNLLFVYGLEDEISRHVFDNVNLPYVRFYYRHTHVANQTRKEPLIIPSDQIESLRIISAVDGKDVIISTKSFPKFDSGQLVRIVSGIFKGVIGRVARFHGQQRVAVQMDSLFTAITAYIPQAFLEPID